VPSRAGRPNNDKRALLNALRLKYPGYQPVLAIAKAAHELTAMAEQEKTAELWRDAGTMHEKVAQYVTPKLKAIELTGEDGGPVEVDVRPLQLVGVKADADSDKSA